MQLVRIGNWRWTPTTWTCLMYFRKTIQRIRIFRWGVWEIWIEIT